MSHQKSYINRYEHLSTRPRAEEAKALILKIGSLVKPIMKSHGWTVGTLGEFFPDQTNLLGLNINGGEKILIRLRPPHSPNTFMPIEDLIGTMLHELTHNVHGPHEAPFYALLATLTKEYDALTSSGWSGDGFHSDGARLGGSHGVPQHIGKIKALEAAEKRRVKMTLMGRGGKLGGAGAGGGGRSLREILADAAERRIKDDKSCLHLPSSSSAAERESKKAAEESEGVDAVDVVDLSGVSDDEEPEASGSGTSGAGKGVIDVDTDDVVVKVEDAVETGADGKPSGSGKIVKPNGSSKPLPRASLPSTKPTTTPSLLPTSKSAPPPKPTSLSKPIPPATEWSCPTCTLLNPLSHLACGACGGPKPRDETRGWWCDVCGEFGNEHGRWMCLGCGRIRRDG